MMTVRIYQPSKSAILSVWEEDYMNTDSSPRPHGPTEEEIVLHQEIIGRLHKPLWSS